MTLVISFGFQTRDSAPPRVDRTWDARHIYNPHGDKALKNKSGLHKDVRRVVLAAKEARQLITEMVEFVLENRPEHIAVGCMWGHHRSVVIAEAVAQRLKYQGRPASAIHRDLWEESP